MNEINIWNRTLEQTKQLPFGIRVCAGKNGDTGTFLGVNRSGTIVVAWDNSKHSKDAKMLSCLVEYAFS